ncbi:alpha/beta hydrolase [Fretibacter rubidus]|uniref:alpha/beta hydrolase n=1 Tax=Fretibacter rubidus TaxID=570162 RepID=UPI003529E210
MALALVGCGAAEIEASDPQTPVTGVMGVTGTVVKVEDFPSQFVKPRHLEIWLPPSYDTAAEKRYPVLYMHDGQNLFDPKQSRYTQTDWGVDEAMTRLINEGKVKEAIVVGIWSTDLRNPEYFPEKAADAYADRFFTEFPDFDADAIQSDNYLRFMVMDLKPYIDATYRTKPGRDDTFIMGSSMGGLISIYGISEYPDVFGGAGGVSTHFPMGDGAIVEYLSGKLPDPATHKIYFDYGTETLDHNYEGYQDRMDAAMKRAGYVAGENWITRKFDGHEHSERAWRARVHVPLTFLLGAEP